MKMKLKTAAQMYEWNDPQVRKLRALGFRLYFDKEPGYAENDRRARSYYYMTEGQKVFIEINSLEELMGLVRKFGSIIVTHDQLEIYNDYRE